MTMTLIETKTLGSAAASIDFTSIPQTYTDLMFLIFARSSTAGSSVEPCLLTFNSDTTGYNVRTLTGDGSTSASANIPARFVFNAPRTATTANTFGSCLLYIPNYSGSVNKAYSSDSVTENNATEAHSTIIAGLWANNAAITSTLFAPTAGNFQTGTTISLYGITKGSDGIVTTS